jgi:hypothetical protein
MLYYQKKNMSYQFQRLDNILNFGVGDKRLKWKKIFIIKMRNVVQKYQNRKPPQMVVSEFIRLINKKCLYECYQHYKQEYLQQFNLMKEKQQDANLDNIQRNIAPNGLLVKSDFTADEFLLAFEKIPSE